MMGIKVIVIEDHPTTRFGLVTLLNREEDIEVVAEYGSGREALEKLPFQSADVILLDVRLPDIPGEQVTEEILRLGRDIKIAAFSAFDDETTIMAMLGAGALGYIAKMEDPQAISTAIRAVARQEPWFSSKALSVVMNFRKGEMTKHPELSTRELEVLRLLPKGYTNHQIAAELSITETTVKNHLTTVYSKLGVRGRAGAIAWAFQHGMTA
jgi:NarL family two-component system response regulator LiaR